MESLAFAAECSNVTRIDVDAGIRYYVGNVSGYKKALYATLRSIRGKLPIIYGMIEYNEYYGFSNIAGTLSTICKSVGANELAETTKELQTAALNYDYSFMARELPKYRDELEDLLSEAVEVVRVIDRIEKTEGSVAVYQAI